MTRGSFPQSQYAGTTSLRVNPLVWKVITAGYRRYCTLIFVSALLMQLGRQDGL
jgi:hypothetical protein